MFGLFVLTILYTSFLNVVVLFSLMTMMSEKSFLCVLTDVIRMTHFAFFLLSARFYGYVVLGTHCENTMGCLLATCTLN